MDLKSTTFLRTAIIVLLVIMLFGLGFLIGWVNKLQEHVESKDLEIKSLNESLSDHQHYIQSLHALLDEDNESFETYFSRIRENDNHAFLSSDQLLVYSAKFSKQPIIIEQKIITQVIDLDENNSAPEVKPFSQIDDLPSLETMTPEENTEKIIGLENPAEPGSLTLVSLKGVKFEYVGKTVNGQANGYGVGIFESGGVYKGFWQDNLRHGNGQYVWKDGDKYEGDFFNDRRTGHGTYTWKNGEYYIGEWKDDMRHGEGVLYRKNGKVKIEGLFDNDKLVK